MEHVNEKVEIKQINKHTLKQKLMSYKRTPGSFIVLLLVLLSAIITIGVLGFF